MSIAVIDVEDGNSAVAFFWLKHSLASQASSGREALSWKRSQRCHKVCFAPRFHSEYRTDGPRPEWGPHYYRIDQRYLADDETDAPQSGEGFLHAYYICQPTCRANAAVARFEAARREIAAALEELQAVVLDALTEVGEAWASLDR